MPKTIDKITASASATTPRIEQIFREVQNGRMTEKEALKKLKEQYATKKK